MSPSTIGLIGLAVLFALMFLRMPIAFALAVVGFFGVVYFQGITGGLGAIGQIPYGTMNMYVWTCVPLFILMGYFALYTGLAAEFYEGIRRWVGHFRGGLAATVILGNTGFGACTGDMIGAAVTFTAISLPEMRKYKYADSLTLGSIAAGSLLAPLIPPSLTFIIYGALTSTSIGELFVAGVFPGLLLSGFYLLVIYIMCRVNPALGPPGPEMTFKQKMQAGTGMWALILVFGTIMGGIFFGLFTPTEAGGAGAFIVLVIGLLRRKLSWQGFKNTIAESGMTISMVAFLLVGTLIFNLFLVLTGLPQMIAEFICGVTLSSAGTLALIAVVLLILGMFLDALALLLIMTPILHPIILNLGIDSVHFGVVLGISIATGTLTPPFGVVVYAMSGVVKDVPLFQIFRAVFPFLVAIVICVLIVIFLPSIATFLPSLM